MSLGSDEDLLAAAERLQQVLREMRAEFARLDPAVRDQVPAMQLLRTHMRHLTEATERRRAVALDLQLKKEAEHRAWKRKVGIA